MLRFCPVQLGSTFICSALNRTDRGGDLPPRVKVHPILVCVAGLGWLGVAASAGAQTVLPASVSPADLSLPVSNELTSALAVAEQAIAVENWERAVNVLQLILDAPEDAVVSPFEPRSVQGKASDLVASLPVDGRQRYERLSTPAAEALWQQARSTGESSILGELVRRYLHTTPGLQAAWRLAAMRQDQGSPLSAALLLERIQSNHASRKLFGGELPLRAALAWMSVGELKRAQQQLAQFEDAPQTITIDGRPLTVPARSEATLTWLQSVVAESTTPGSSNDRRPHAPPFLPPFEPPDWSVPSLCTNDLLALFPERSDELNEVVAKLQTEQRRDAADTGRVLIPAAAPLICRDRLLFRGPDRLSAISMQDGSPIWIATPVDFTFRELAEKSDFSPHDDLTRELYLGQRAWRDETSSSISCDEDAVYTIMDCGMLGAVDPGNAFQGRRRGKGAFGDNTLQAVSLRGGKKLWSIGGPVNETEDGLGGLYFLGPPLSHEGNLYILAEDRGQVRLLAIDPATEPRPTLLWSQALYNTPPLMDVLQHEQRRTMRLSPAVDGHLMICPTGAGSVVAVDLLERRLQWSAAYDLRGSGLPQFQPPRGRQPRTRSETPRNALDRLLDTGRWRQTNPIRRGNLLLLPTPDSDSLVCIRISDGKVVWTRPRNDWQSVAAVHEDRVVLIGATRLDAVALKTGEPAWEEATPIPSPSGIGIQHGDLYTLPLSTGEIVTFDLRDGRILARSPLPDEELPGNLLAAGGRLFHQNAVGVSAFASPDEHPELLTDQSQELTPRQLARRGELRLHGGDQEGGIADLRAAVRARPDDRSRRVLAAVLMEGLRIDFPKHQGEADEIERLVRGTPRETAFRRLYAAQLQTHARPVEAFGQLLKLGELIEAGEELESIVAGLSVGPDRWVQAHVHDLLAEAELEHRDAMLDRLRERLTSAAAEADEATAVRALQGLARMARGTAVEVDALTALARRSSQQSPAYQSWLWLQLRKKGGASIFPETTARLASLCLSANDARTAAAYVEELSTSLAETVILDGQTGRELLQSWRDDARLQDEVELAERTGWPEGDLEITNRAFDDRLPRFHVLPVIGKLEGPLAGWGFTYDDRQQRVSAHTPAGRFVWEVILKNESGGERSIPTGVMVQGHLVMVLWETRFQIVSTLTSEAGRYRSIMETRKLVSDGYQRSVFPGRGRHDAAGRSIGIAGPLTSDLICYFADDELVGIDPWTGRDVWRRDHTQGVSGILADDEYVVVLPYGQGDLLVLRSADGTLIARRPRPLNVLQPPVAADWGRLIGSLESIDIDSDRLAFYDPVTDEPAWERRCVSPVHWTTVDGGSLLLVEGDQQCTLLRPSDGVELFSVKLPIKPPDGDPWESLTVTSDADRVYVVMNAPQNSRVLRFERQATSDRPVNGRLCAIERATGEISWTTDIAGQYLDPNHPPGWPVLILAARQRARR